VYPQQQLPWLTAYTNHGKKSSSKRNSGRKPKLSERYRRTSKKTVSKSQTTTRVELSIRLEDSFSTKTARRELKKCSTHGKLAIVEPLISENNIQWQKDGVMIIKPGCLMMGNP
jgi:hypothetical protein